MARTAPNLDPMSGLPIPRPEDSPGGPEYSVVCLYCLNGKTARLKITMKNHYSIYCLGCGTRVFVNTSSGEAAVRAWQRLLSDDDTADALARSLVRAVEPLPS